MLYSDFQEEAVYMHYQNGPYVELKFQCEINLGFKINTKITDSVKDHHSIIQV